MGSAGARSSDTAARVRALGIDAPLGRSFACILPGHDHAARLHPATGFWRYHCYDAAEGFGLAEVRAYLAYDGIRRISPVEAVRWRERLDHEAGLLDRDPVRLLVPGYGAECGEADRERHRPARRAARSALASG